jgi:hypothetical protein
MNFRFFDLRLESWPLNPEVEANGKGEKSEISDLKSQIKNRKSRILELSL